MNTFNVIQKLLFNAAILQMNILNFISGMIHEAIVNRDASAMKSLKRNEIQGTDDE